MACSLLRVKREQVKSLANAINTTKMAKKTEASHALPLREYQQ